MSHGPADASFWVLVAWWWGMMAIMMVPITWPWLRTLYALAGDSGAPGGAGGSTGLSRMGRGEVPASIVPAFVGGYLLVWLAFSLGAAQLQLLVAPHGAAEPGVRAGILLGAGLYQLTPAKSACLKHCRSPVSVLLARWPLRTWGAGRVGFEHGLFCLGCCWALMLLGLGAGAAGWLWMAGLVVLVAVEKLAPVGQGAGRLAGAGLVAAGLIVLVGAVADGEPWAGAFPG